MLSPWFFLLLAAVPQNALDSGRQALAAGDLPRAEQLFKRYLSEHPNSTEALSNLAAVHARREQFSEAVALYEKALKPNPGLRRVTFISLSPLGGLTLFAK